MFPKTVKHSDDRLRSAGQKRPGDEADHNAGDGPFDEVCHRLLHRQCQPDVQVDIVVHHEGADREDSDRGAEARAVGEAGAALVEHCVKHRKHQHGREHGGHSGGHRALHGFLGAVHGRVFAEPIAKRRKQAERKTPESEVCREGAQSCENDARVAHIVTSSASKESSLSSDSEAPWDTLWQKKSSGHPSCVRTTLVPLPCSKNSTVTRVTAWPKSAWYTIFSGSTISSYLPLNENSQVPPLTASCIFWVNEPPARKSMTISHLVASLQPDHCCSFSACVHQPNTSCRGASKTRVSWRRLPPMVTSDLIVSFPLFVRFSITRPVRQS